MNITHYRVTVEEMEGDNYAGGRVERVYYLTSLDSVRWRASLIKDITPVAIREFPSLTVEQIAQAIERNERMRKAYKRQREIESLERRLENLRKEGL